MNRLQLRDFCVDILREHVAEWWGEQAEVVPIEEEEKYGVRSPALQIVGSSDHNPVLYMENLYKKLIQEGDFSREAVADQLQFMLSSAREQLSLVNLPAAAIKERICVVVMDSPSYSELGKEISVPWGDLWACPVVDSANATRRVLPEDLEKLKMDEGAVVALGVDQTRAHLTGQRLEVRRVPGNKARRIPEITIVRIHDDTYSTSLLLLPELLGQVFHLEDGDLFAMPHRGVLFLVKGDNLAARATLGAVALMSYKQAPYRRSPYVYRYHASGPKQLG